MPDPTPENSADAAVDQAAELLAGATAIDGPAQPTAADAAASDPGVVDPLASLPTYARDLLRIQVAVTVTLAAQRKSVKEIVELGPGAIVKFDKTCDQPLELCVGSREIATGEVVKVGDKFGLRIGRFV